MTRKRVLLVDWDAAAAAERAQKLGARGWEVETESVDGAAAYRRARELAGELRAVVVVASQKASHGIETAASLREAKATRDLPILFVDPPPDVRERIRARIPGATTLSSAELEDALARLPEEIAEETGKRPGKSGRRGK
jgi:DNA-binding response OmpR family regulator